MVHDQRSALADYITELISNGKAAFTAKEAETAISVSHGAFLDAAERLQNRKFLHNPRQGFYIAVPPFYQIMGAPSPSWYIDALMAHEKQDYYVALLNAGALHGATHQGVQVFQVVTSKRIPKMIIGRSRILFYYRKNLSEVAEGIVSHKTHTGTMQISSPALTALDLFRYPYATAGIDNAATVLTDIGPKINKQQLARLSTHMERPVVQRLGFMLDMLGFGAKTDAMHDKLYAGQPPGWAELDRTELIDPDLRLDVIERNSRWRIRIRRYPEPD